MLFHLRFKKMIVKIFQVMAIFDGAVDRLLITQRKVLMVVSTEYFVRSSMTPRYQV